MFALSVFRNLKSLCVSGKMLEQLLNEPKAHWCSWATHLKFHLVLEEGWSFREHGAGLLG